MIAGYDLREVTGDFIGKADYVAAQQEVWPLLSCILPPLIIDFQEADDCWLADRGELQQERV